MPGFVICFLLALAAVGFLLATYSMRALIVAFRRGLIQQNDQTLAFSDSPIRFFFAVIHIVLGILAGLAFMGMSLAPLIRG